MATRTQWFALEFKSSDGRYISSGRREQPESSPAAVQIAHGFAEFFGSDDPVGQRLEELAVHIQRRIETLCRVSPTISIANRNAMLHETDREEVLRGEHA